MKCFPAIIGLALFYQTCLGLKLPNFEVITIPVENGTVEILDKINATETIQKDYLDEVVFALRNQDWNKEEESCLNQTILLIQNLQNSTLRAVWAWDSMPKEPQGLLYGSHYQLGNFDECLNPPRSLPRPELKTQYCLAEIVLEKADNDLMRQHNAIVDPDQTVLDFIEARRPYSQPLNTLTWGVCVPESCGSSSVERILRMILARSYLGGKHIRLHPKITTETCQKQEESRAYDGLFWAFIAVFAVLTAMAMICTYLNKERNQSEPKTLKHDVIEAFCLINNTQNLSKTQKTGTEVLYGVRFLGICLIVMGHQFSTLIGGAVSNGVRVDEVIPTLIGLPCIRADLLVDTFFLLSGFLTATAFSQSRRNPLIAILRRYVRLMPGFAMVVFFAAAVYPYIGSGPLWPRAVAANTDQCRKNWWLSLLMLNNYIDSENICLIISWYIPCDFHYFCVAAILYWLYTHQPRLGLSCAVVISVISVILPGILTYINDWSPVMLLTPDKAPHPLANPDFHRTYIRSHTRAAAYVVGFISGFIFVKNKKETMSIPQKWAILGTISGIAIMIMTMFSGSLFLWHTYHPIIGAAYAAFNRPVWAVGVAMVVLCCSLGHVILIKSFLSWSVWVPLSRLAYGVYLTHYLIISRKIFLARSPKFFDIPEIINDAVGALFLGCLGAFILWLIVEAPAIRLFDIWLKQLSKEELQQHKIEEKLRTQTEDLRGNLNTVRLTSKI